MKKFFNVLLCGVSAMNTISEKDMAYMAELSSEIFDA